MAVGARDGNVSTGEHEVGFLVLGQAEGGRSVRFKIVAAIAGIEIRRRRKLARMLIGVTVGTALELDLEERVLPLGHVTLRALQARVTALQRISTRCVLFHRKGRWLPSFDRVARSAFSTVSALGKLAIMRIRLVAIHAFLEDQRLFEISVRMALGAIDGGMLAFQGKLGLRMVEALVNRLQRNFLPSARVVARLAALRKVSVVWILVAIGTLVKGNAYVLRLAV